MHLPKAITDAHVHLWRLDLGWYPHLEGVPNPGHTDDRVGYFSSLVGRDYLLSDYWADVRPWAVTKLVHVVAATAPPRWSDETMWLQAMADAEGQPRGSIGWIDLRQSEADLDRETQEHCASANFRGFRNHEGVDYEAPYVSTALGVFSRHGLVYDLVCNERQLAPAASVVRRFPDMQFVLEHTGWPSANDAETYGAWKAGMAELARCENVACKLSGLPMTIHDCTVEKLRPWVLSAAEAFGSDRLLFASNQPVDGLFASFDVLISAYLEILAGASADEVQRIFADNADRLYRL